MCVKIKDEDCVEFTYTVLYIQTDVFAISL